MSDYKVEWEIYLKSGQAVQFVTAHNIEEKDDLPHIDDTEQPLRVAITQEYQSFVFCDKNGDMVFIVPSQVSAFKNKVVDYPEEEQA